jgi:GT2 family glycosyltransferase
MDLSHRVPTSLDRKYFGSSTIDVSIVIIAARATPVLEESLAAIAELRGPVTETIVVLDDVFKSGGGAVRYIVSGAVGPAEKRDIGARSARGALLAFIDDDAYPSPGWLAAAVPLFDNSDVWAVGGPGVTPPTDGFRAQVSGWAYAAWMVSGPARYRYVPQAARRVDDYPSMNLIVRRSAFKQVGGFDSEYYPGEDTKFCLELVRRGGQIIYDPDVLVYHHRRPVISGHLRQISGYGWHRGYFARVFPETSRRVPYFVPSLWVLWLSIGAVFVIWMDQLRPLYFLTIGIYLAAVFGSMALVIREAGRFWIGIAVGPTIVLSHLVYGWRFLGGLAKCRL